ncbi:heat shock factor 2-binding protein-like [Cimex lectularius]|uniref:Heat shock factor 2-binding protein n=1 Tax=Cimex lectularius TaxID=79782 RepID=A0A8I6RI66_CIMLE|nr:heat shock factor 2-binding protein-like [Cimex lectularius]
MKTDCNSMKNISWLKHMYTNQSTELEILKSKYEQLQKEWDSQQEYLGRLQGEVYKLRNQLQTQSSFCAALGSVLGNLVWKASRLQPVVELLLTTNKLSEFFCIVSGTLISFMGTYTREMPEVKCNETQFILSMCGIVANIAAVPEGRQYIVTDANGKETIEQMLKVLPNIPHKSGSPLKRIILMVLYNISINQTGLNLIQEDKNLLTTLAHIVASEECPELKVLALRLLESLTFEIPNTIALLKILQQIQKDKIEALQNAGDAEIRQYANNIMANFRKAEEALGFIIDKKDDTDQFKHDVTNDKCRK